MTSWCSGQRKSTSRRFFPTSIRWLQSGAGKPAAPIILSRCASSSLRRSFLPSSFARPEAGRQSLEIARSVGAPRRRCVARMRSISPMSRIRRTAARSVALRREPSLSIPARSTMVREGLVHGIASQVPASRRPGWTTRRLRMPSIARPALQGAITSTTAGARSSNPKRAPAVRCETTVPFPQASEAASIRPRASIFE